MLHTQEKSDDIQKKEETEPTPIKFWSMSLKEKYDYFKSNITVEPMLACYIMPSVLASLATQNLSLEKACRVNLAYEEHVCDALTVRDTANYTKEEAAVQQLVANMTIWKTIVQSALPAALMLFMGAWSDRVGRRKPCMLLPIVGEFLCSIGQIVCTYFFNELPMEAAGIVESVFPAITGGWFTMFMAVFSYIGDVTSVEMRTLRIGIVNVFVSLGVPIGMALSGILYAKIGFYGVFSISTVLYVMSFLYGYYGIKEVRKPQPEKKKPEKNEPEKKCTNVFNCKFLRDFFDINHLSETFKVAFKAGKEQRRMRVIMLMVACMVIIGPLHGEIAVLYLFTRFRFNWNEVDFSIFSTYSMITNLIGTMVSVGVFSHWLKIDDAIIGVLSCMSKILSSFMYAFATTTWMMYVAPLVEILNGTSFIAMRSIATKLVPSDELGKVNSIFGVCEALMPLAYGPMYSAVYRDTMSVFPGAFFVLGGALTTPAVFIFLWMYSVHKKVNTMRDIEAKVNEDKKKEESEMTMKTLTMNNENKTQTNGDITHQNGVDNKSYIPDSDE